MAIHFPLTRRALLRHGTLIGLGFGLAAPARATEPEAGLAAIAGTAVNPILINRALLALARHGDAIWSRDVVGIADFGLPSSVPRLHLIDLLAGTVTSLRVTHGKGSDPDHSGMLQTFSDAVGSNATSEGAYLTGETYMGVHGVSRRLTGLDPDNAHALERKIVIHAARYADADVLARQGVLGRSDGCFAVSNNDLVTAVLKLGRGRMLYAGRATLPVAAPPLTSPPASPPPPPGPAPTSPSPPA